MAEIESQQERTERLERLKSELKEFASSDTPKRERKLVNLFSLIKNTLTDPVIAEQLISNGETQIKLRRSAESSFETQFIVNGENQDVWDSGYTVAVLSQDGDILGIIYKPTPALKEYGYLGSYALGKAVCELHLEKAGKKDGLSNLDNFDYISDIGLTPFKDLFTGSYPGPVNLNGNIVYLGGSGCAVNKDYLRGLLGGAVPTPDTLAGTFDAEFCKLTAMYLTNPSKTPLPKSEPNTARIIRIQN